MNILVSNRVVTLTPDDCFTYASFPSGGNLKVISCCSTRSWNTLNGAVCHHVCLAHGHPGNFSVTMTTLLCTPLPHDCVANVQEDKGGKKNVRHWGTAMEHRQTVATDWPTLTTNHLKAQLDLFEMLHISLILVSAFSAIYSHGKVCRSILQANPSLSSYINKASHMLWNSWSGFKGWFGGAINPLYLTHWRMSSHFFGLQSLDHN